MCVYVYIYIYIYIYVYILCPICPLCPLRPRAEAETVQAELVRELFSILEGYGFRDQESVEAVVNRDLGPAPSSVRLMALVHTYEYAKVTKEPYSDPDDLAIAFSRQLLPERAMEMVCRVTLEQAIKLARGVAGEEAAYTIDR